MMFKCGKNTQSAQAKAFVTYWYWMEISLSIQLDLAGEYIHIMAIMQLCLTWLPDITNL